MDGLTVTGRKKRIPTHHPTDEDLASKMERLLSGGWLVYSIRTRHKGLKVGTVVEVKRNLNGVVICRAPVRPSPHVTWPRPATATYPINGKWYIEGLDPKRWNRRRPL